MKDRKYSALKNKQVRQTQVYEKGAKLHQRNIGAIYCYLFFLFG